MNFAEATAYLRLIRKDRGLTQMEVAAQVPCSQSTISNFENGLMRGRYDMLGAYADVLEVELPDELRGLIEMAR